MTCLLLDLVILTFLLAFLAIYRWMTVRSNTSLEWLGTLFFGVGLVYAVVTIIADSLQAATVVDALSGAPSPLIVRAMMESMYLMYGSVALFLMAAFMAIGGYLAIESGTLPRWSGWTGYLCALACAAFIPSMYIQKIDPNGFYNPAGWGPLAVAAGLPLALWMIVCGVLMLRKQGETI
jgi:hypothetical protein